MSITTTFEVTGMSCEHCVAAVTREVTAIPDVTGVDVDLAAGTFTTRSQVPLDLAEVRAAVDEAGYDLVDPT